MMVTPLIIKAIIMMVKPLIIKAIIIMVTPLIIKAIIMMFKPLNESLALLSVLILDGRGRHRQTFPIFKLSRCLFTNMMTMVTIVTTVTNNFNHSLYDCDQHSTHVCSYKALEM